MADDPRQGELPEQASDDSTAPNPWYREGLKFECTQCGNCCTGEPGFVWVANEEIESLARHLAIADVDEFTRNYTRAVGRRISLKEYENGDCIFFDPESRGCRVYAARPKQCRTWPFWDSNLETEQDWHLTCQECPGAGKGHLYTLAAIESARKEVRV